MHTTTTETARLIARFAALRTQIWVRHYELGRSFSASGGRQWKDRGFSGLASACWELSQDLLAVPGGWDAYVAARELAADCAAVRQ